MLRRLLGLAVLQAAVASMDGDLVVERGAIGGATAAALAAAVAGQPAAKGWMAVPGSVAPLLGGEAGDAVPYRVAGWLQCTCGQVQEVVDQGTHEDGVHVPHVLHGRRGHREGRAQDDVQLSLKGLQGGMLRQGSHRDRLQEERSWIVLWF